MKARTRFLQANGFTGQKRWEINDKEYDLWNDSATGTTMIFKDDMTPAEVVEKIDGRRRKFRDAKE